MHAHLRGPKSLLTLYLIYNKTWQMNPDMNIKVAALTVSEKTKIQNMKHIPNCAKSLSLLFQLHLLNSISGS